MIQEKSTQHPVNSYKFTTDYKVLLFHMMPYGMGHPFGQLGSDLLAVSPPSFFHTSSLLTGGAVRS